MAAHTCLFQVSSLVPRTRSFASLFVRRACAATHTPAPSTRHSTRCLASSPTDSADPSEPADASPGPTAPPDDAPRASQVDQAINPDALLAAFDTFIDDIDTESEENLSARERRKLARDRQLEEAREAHMRRLDILSEIPAELFVDDVKSKCPGCGTVLQSDSEGRPGYLPREVLENRIAESTNAAVAKGSGSDVEVANGDQDDDTVIGPPKAAKKALICQRCFRLTHYGKIESHLRVPSKRLISLPTAQKRDAKSTIAQTPAPVVKSELSAAKFRKVLERLRGINAVVIYLVDIFDFHGSFISSLRDIIGVKNPIVLAVNKTDLLPRDHKPERVERWIEHECAGMGLRDVTAIHSISSTKGTGVKVLMADALRIAKNRRADIYVVGAANVGKSSFINQLIRLRQRTRNHQSDTGGRKSGGASRDSRDTGSNALTTSVVPGTTLDVIRIPLGANTSLYDTPGLIMPHQLTNFLEAKELRAVLPDKSVDKVTYRLGEGKALYIGGLARIEVVSGRPFFFTAFFSPQVKVHPGTSDDPDEFLARHAGSMLTPPFSQERYLLLGEWTSKSFTASGEGWKKSCLDIVLSGLGWVAVTGAGNIRLKVCVPAGVGVFTREPLMPFEAQAGVSTYTGTTGVNKRQIKKATRNRRAAREDY